MERLLKEGRQLTFDEFSAPRLPASSQSARVDARLLQRARKFFSDNFFSVNVTMLYGLVSLMYVPSVSRVLEATKRTNSRAGAFSRYLNTM